IDLVQQNLDNRHTKGDLKTFVSAYDERRQLIGQVEELKALRNSVTEEISKLNYVLYTRLLTNILYYSSSSSSSK
ncbi:Serine-tRNA ligase, partial [human gut metagenome]